jgi:hypothetical protein
VQKFYPILHLNRLYAKIIVVDDIVLKIYLKMKLRQLSMQNCASTRQKFSREHHPAFQEKTKLKSCVSPVGDSEVSIRDMEFDTSSTIIRCILQKGTDWLQL